MGIRAVLLGIVFALAGWCCAAPPAAAAAAREHPGTGA